MSGRPSDDNKAPLAGARGQTYSRFFTLCNGKARERLESRALHSVTRSINDFTAPTACFPRCRPWLPSLTNPSLIL